MDYNDEITSVIDVQDYLFNLKETLLLLWACDSWVSHLCMDADKETNEKLSQVGFFVREFLDKEPEKLLTRCIEVLDETRRRDRRNNQAN